MTITLGTGINGNDIIDIRTLKLIGIHGHAGTGKSTIANYLNSAYQKCYAESFAAPLKVVCAAAFGIPESHFYDTELKEQETFWGISPRKMAQFVGTEMFRELTYKLYGDGVTDLYPSHWVQLLEARLSGKSNPPINELHYESGECVVIHDVRFQDEADWIWNNGGVIINLRRDGCFGSVGIKNHSSESGIHTTRDISRNYGITNNGTEKELYATVDDFITYYQSYLQLERKPQEISNISVDDF